MKNILGILVILMVSGCATVTHDLAQTLKHADGRSVGVRDIDFKALQTRNRGESCTWSFLFYIPLFGDDSIITAADNGNINNVELVGKTGLWYFPVNKNCTVVFGDS